MKFFKKASKVLTVGVFATSVLLTVPTNTASAKESDALNFEVSQEGRYDITFKSESQSASVLNALSKQRNSGFEVIDGYEYSPNTVTVKMDKEIADELAKNPSVLSIKPDILVKADATYTAPFHQLASPAIVGTNSDDAFKKGVSGQGVKVAILDSGVDTDNPMLTHAIKGGASVVSWSNNYEDYTGHGTNVSGTIAGKYQGKPIGVAPDVDLYAVKVSQSATSSSAYLSDITRGIEWAVANKMDAINISFEAGGLDDEFAKASNKAHFAGIPIFHSAGNNKDNRDTYAGRCGYAGVYCVSAVDYDGKLANFSAYGNQKVVFSSYGVDAPTVEVGKTTPSTTGGTSFSSPMAMGTYALYKSDYKNLNSFEILIKMVQNSADMSHKNPEKAVAGLAVYKDDTKQESRPQTPTVSLLDVDGKKVTVRVTVPESSPKFNKLEFDYYWIYGLSDKVVTMPDTRKYDLVFEAPNFNDSYRLDVRAFDRSLSSNWSNTLSFETGMDVTNIVEDFDNSPNLKFDVVGDWYVNIMYDLITGSTLQGQTKTSYFNVDAGSKGGIIYIDYLVDSYNNSDTFEILVDGVARLRTTDEIKNATTFKYDLSSGYHTITLKYSKNASNGYGMAYIEKIKLSKYN